MTTAALNVLKAKRTLWVRRLAHRTKRLDYWKHQKPSARRANYIKKWERLVGQARNAKATLDQQIRIAEDKPVPAKGIDVSAHQGVVDFAKVKAAGYRFVYVKATEGQDFSDPLFVTNVKAAKAAGLKVGAYHYLHPRPTRSGDVEAAWFVRALKAAGLGKGDLLPVVDVEETHFTGDGRAKPTADYTRQTLIALRRSGYRPMVYTFPAFIGDWPAEFADTPLWIANTDVRAPHVPKPWTRFVVWQHDFHGRVPGVAVDVDLNTTPDLRRVIA
jgi:GH25 family lysozyme M1 (1,4-beta-N-acetylmuramidase)